MKNIVITGSTRGIGFEMAKQFLVHGCNVTLSGRGLSLKDEMLSQIKEYNNLEQREIWEYDLDLKQDEIDRFLKSGFEVIIAITII